MTDLITVYRLHSIIDRWPHRGSRYDGVYVTWFKEQNDLPLGELFANWRADVVDYAHSQADECFTEAQADVLAAYLHGHHDTVLVRTPVDLPLAGSGVIGVSALAVGGDQDFYMLSREDGYTLPFGVFGYYRIAGAESCFGVDAAAGEELPF